MILIGSRARTASCAWIAPAAECGVIGSSKHEVEVAVELRADVGEGPHWDERTGSLWFVDLTAGTVIRLERAGGAVTEFSVGQEVGAVIPRQRGGLVLAVRDGIAVVSEDGDGFEIVVPVEREIEANRMNDAKCDAAGRLFVRNDRV